MNRDEWRLIRLFSILAPSAALAAWVTSTWACDYIDARWKEHFGLHTPVNGIPESKWTEPPPWQTISQGSEQKTG